MRTRAKTIVLVSSLLLATPGMTGCASTAGGETQSANSTIRSPIPKGNFVCFKLAASSPEEMARFKALVIDSGIAEANAVQAGLKADAALSVLLAVGEDAQAWIDAVPAPVSNDPLVRSIQPDSEDCARVDV